MFGHNPGVDETTPEAIPEASPEPALEAAAVPVPAARPDPAAIGERLRQRFPALFAGPAKPLKLRIQADIQEQAPGEFSKQDLSAFFRRHTTSTSYLIAITKATTRFGLDGQPAGELSEEHRQIAAEELARRRTNRQAREQLEMQQRRNRAGLLHDFERTTLTAANFCALKGVAVEELDGLLAIAREEARAASSAPRPPQQQPGPHQGRREGAPRGEHRHGARRR